jgi:hypothetical protein
MGSGNASDSWAGSQIGNRVPLPNGSATMHLIDTILGTFSRLVDAKDEQGRLYSTEITEDHPAMSDIEHAHEAYLGPPALRTRNS